MGFPPEAWNALGDPNRWYKLESIRHLRHHPKTGVLHYRRVVPGDLRAIIGKGTISATLGSKTLDHAALIRWVEIDRDAQRLLEDARHQLSRRTVPVEGLASIPAFIDIRECVAAFASWKEREVGGESLRLYQLAGQVGGNEGLVSFNRDF